jgi:hypothetical protein
VNFFPEAGLDLWSSWLQPRSWNGRRVSPCKFLIDWDEVLQTLLPELSSNHDPHNLGSQVDRIIAMSHCTWPKIIFEMFFVMALNNKIWFF